MRVLHVDLESGFRGGQRQVLLLCEGQARQGVGVCVAVRAGEAMERACAERGLPTIPLQQEGPLDPRAPLALMRALREQPFDLLHAHSSHSHTAAILGALRPGAPPPLIVSRRVDFSVGRPPWNRFKYGRVACFVAISEAVAEVLGEGGVERSRIRVVHSAVEPPRPPVRSRAQVRRALGLGPGQLMAINTAALVDHKDHETAVRAMARVRQPVHLFIAGEGPLRGAIERVIEQERVGSVVRLLGQRDDVPDLLAAADFFVVSSHLEGLNTSLMDAGLAGLAVAGTAAGGIPEVVIHGQTGILVPPREPQALAAAIDELASDPRRREQLGEAGAARVHEVFSVERLVRQTLEVYEQVLNP